MDFLSLYLIFQCIIIVVLVIIFICYVVKTFKKNKIKEPKIIAETDTEVIYYYGNGDEYHSPIRRD